MGVACSMGYGGVGVACSMGYGVWVWHVVIGILLLFCWLFNFALSIKPRPLSMPGEGAILLGNKGSV